MNCHLCCREVHYPMTCHRKDTEEGSLWECCECKGHGFDKIIETNFEEGVDTISGKCCSQMSKKEQERYLNLPSHYASFYSKRFNEVR